MKESPDAVAVKKLCAQDNQGSNSLGDSYANFHRAKFGKNALVDGALVSTG